MSSVVFATRFKIKYVNPLNEPTIYLKTKYPIYYIGKVGVSSYRQGTTLQLLVFTTKSSLIEVVQSPENS